jgi:hypothetical protein
MFVADGPLFPHFLSFTMQWVPLDKSEGVVKGKLSLAMRKHRFVGHKSLATKTL